METRRTRHDALHAKLDEILDSDDPAWIKTMSMTLDAMHLQFLQELKRRAFDRRFVVVERNRTANASAPPAEVEKQFKP